MSGESKDLWKRGLAALEAAKLLSPELPDDSASRAYYAVFYAVSAYFAVEGKSFSKHSAVEHAFHKDLIKSGLIPKEFGGSYAFLLDMRRTGDYGNALHVTQEEAFQAVSVAKSLIQAIRDIRPELESGI